MLKFIRDNAKGVIAWIIVIIIIIPFALWGVNEYFTGGGETYVAKVGDRDISLREYQNHYQRELATRRQVLGSAFDPNDPGIRRDVIERVVNAEVMAQTVRESGFRVSDAQLGQRIRSMPEFRSGEQFDADLYQRLLASLGISQGQFEEGLRSDLMVDQLVSGVADTAFLTPRELEMLLRLAEQRRRVEHLVLDAADFAGHVDIDDAAIETFYRENRDLYAVPERVTARYIELSMRALMADIQVDEDTLRRLYEERGDAFSVGEERRAHHILVEVPAGADEATVDAARERAEELLAMIEDEGRSFEEVATEHSDDAGSAASGGDLGYFSRGTMVGPFEDAVFEMDEGEVRGPVRSPFGFHIVRVDDVRAGSSRPFEEVAPELEQEFRRARAEERFFELTERLTDLTFEHSDTLEVAAEALGLEIRETAPFSRDAGEGVAADPAFRDAAFSADVLEQGFNSMPIELGRDRAVVLRVADRHPASHLPLDEVREQIAEELRRRETAALARQAGERMLERMRDGASLEALAREHGAEWHAPTVLSRDDGGIDPEIIDAAFAMRRPAEDGPALEGLSLASGDYAVIALHEVVDGDPAEVSEDEQRMNAQAIAQYLGQRGVGAVIDAARERKEVRVFENRL